MKTLYTKVVESILDDQDEIINDISDKAIENMVVGTFRDNRVKWNPKKKIAKLSHYSLHLVMNNNEVCIYGGNKIYTPIKNLTDLGITFDGSLLISSDVIISGFKLSQVGIVGKNHRLNISTSYKKSNELSEDLLKSFLDCPVDCFDVIDIDCRQNLVSSSEIGKFRVVCTCPPVGFGCRVECKIRDCKASVLYAKQCFSYIDPHNKYKSFADAFENEPDYSYITGRDASGSTYSGYVITHKQFCRDLIKNNPGCKIIVELGYSKPTHIWMDGDELKYKEITGTKPWQKI